MTSMLDGVVSHSRADALAVEKDRRDSSDRLAATLLRREALAHTPCAGASCRHRNHRRDKAHFLFLCEVLALEPGIAGPADYQSALAWAAVSRTEAQAMRGHK